MAHSHNCLLRGLNTIVLQAPYVPSSDSPAYSAQDVQDLLFYVASWVKTVNWHHHTEETCMFPEIEALTGVPGIMEGPMHQHDEFHDDLNNLLQYAQETKPEDYRWDGEGGMKSFFDRFSPSLTKHLYEEIDVFLGLKEYDSNQLRKCWDKAEELAKGKGKLNMLVGYLIFKFTIHYSRICYTLGSVLIRWVSPNLHIYSMMSSRACLEHAIRRTREAITFLHCPVSFHMPLSIGLGQATEALGDSTHVISGDNLCHFVSYPRTNHNSKLREFLFFSFVSFLTLKLSFWSSQECQIEVVVNGAEQRYYILSHLAWLKNNMITTLKYMYCKTRICSLQIFTDNTVNKSPVQKFHHIYSQTMRISMETAKQISTS